MVKDVSVACWVFDYLTDQGCVGSSVSKFFSLTMKKRTRETTETETTQPKRQRTDTFTHFTPEKICTNVNKIIQGEHETYKLDKEAESKEDALQKVQTCWAVLNKSHGKRCNNLWSAAAYRPFYAWWVYSKKDEEERKKHILDLERVDRNGEDKWHHAHRCGNDWCVNPEHIRLLPRKENEVDKCFHYFLNNPETRQAFLQNQVLRNKVAQRGVW